MSNDRIAALLQVAGLGCGVGAGFCVSVAIGLVVACAALILVGLAVERRQ